MSVLACRRASRLLLLLRAEQDKGAWRKEVDGPEKQARRVPAADADGRHLFESMLFDRAVYSDRPG